MSAFYEWYEKQPDSPEKFPYEERATEQGWKGAVEACAAEVEAAGCHCRMLLQEFGADRREWDDGKLVDFEEFPGVTEEDPEYIVRHDSGCPIAQAAKLREMAR